MSATFTSVAMEATVMGCHFPLYVVGLVVAVVHFGMHRPCHVVMFGQFDVGLSLLVFLIGDAVVTRVQCFQEC